MTEKEKAEFLKEHLDFLQSTAKDAAENEFSGDVPEISKQIIAVLELLSNGD